MSPPACRRECVGGSSGGLLVEARKGSGPNYSSSTAPHHHWQKHSSIAALSKHINSAELKAIDFFASFFLLLFLSEEGRRS